MKIRIDLLFITTLALLLGFAGCKKDENEGVGPESENAVFMNVNISTPDGYTNYIGAFPEVPRSIDRTKLMEFGRGAHVAVTHKGQIFTYGADTKVVTKWDVDNTNTIAKNSSFSVADKNVGSYPGFVIFSDTRGFIFEVNQGKVIEFNPTAMTLTRDISVPVPEYRNAYFGFLPKVYGNKIVSNLLESDWNTKSMSKRVGVALFDVTTSQLTYHFDQRGHTGYEYWLDSKGYFYTLPDLSTSMYKVLGNTKDSPKTGLVRFNVATGQFDPAFYWNLEDILNGHVVNVYPINDTKLFVSYLPKPISATYNWDNIWEAVKVEVKMFDITTGTASDIRGIPNGRFTSSSAGEANFNYNGALYLPMYIRSGDNQAVSLYKITENGAELHSEHTNVWISEISRLR